MIQLNLRNPKMFVCIYFLKLHHVWFLYFLYIFSHSFASDNISFCWECQIFFLVFHYSSHNMMLTQRGSGCIWVGCGTGTAELDICVFSDAHYRGGGPPPSSYLKVTQHFTTVKHVSRAWVLLRMKPLLLVKRWRQWSSPITITVIANRNEAHCEVTHGVLHQTHLKKNPNNNK